MADKYLYNNAGTITEREATVSSAGAGSAGKIPALDGNGKLAANMMPTGFGADVNSIQASENLAANDLVNIHDVGGSARVRKADASAAGKEAHGFVLAAVTSGNNADVYSEGTNAGLTGLTPGKLFLSTTPGQATSTAPSGSGQVVQVVGVATSATAFNFEAQPPIVLA
ncbi:hypothetical protein NDR87_31460 [Nocardia sp. CDC159]|uniref:Uncharacterized protein n=1 Tax=Nocardia pulmonis TaxID=2951408 RepID=A0A9X2EC01_9NOCA|nr:MULTISPECIES: hypothetical protein [Nocardia]MCM6777932.1 hypothetical protein [Nocardia pulmonis]MCM6790897.1 hypothetical protein [Nocardia sp. CDC159]